MFTGLIEETGTVERITPGAGGIRLAVRSRLCVRGLRKGDSLAVNGCCLTVVRVGREPRRRLIEFDLLQETWQRTNLQFAQSGSAVNLERALPANGRVGGHFVSGHIDGMGRITRWEQVGKDWLLEVSAPADVLRYIIFKGSVAVDGISLTVASVRQRTFQIWIIPHTHELTALRERRVGDRVNLEADLLAKYVERLCEPSA